MLIRDVTLADARALAQVHVDSWRHAYRALLPADFLNTLSVENRAQLWHESIRDGIPFVLVAEVGAMVVGFAAYGPCRDPGVSPEEYELWAIYVAPEYLATGIGLGLWSHAKANMLAAGATTISLWVLVGNEPAKQFYRKAGFQEQPGALKSLDISGASVDEIRFVWRACS